VSGHVKAREGDLREAALRYLDALRYASDLGMGRIENAEDGAAAATFALGAIDGLERSGRTDANLRALLAEKLAAIEPFLPSAADAIHWERLERRQFYARPGLGEAVLAVFAKMDAYLERAESLARSHDPAPRAALRADRAKLPRLLPLEEVPELTDLMALEDALRAKYDDALARARAR